MNDVVRVHGAALRDLLSQLPEGYCMVFRCPQSKEPKPASLDTILKRAVLAWADGQGDAEAYRPSVHRMTDGRVLSSTVDALIAGVPELGMLYPPGRALQTAAGGQLSALGWSRRKVRRFGTAEIRWHRPIMGPDAHA